MGMDLREDCPHCNAIVGQICEESCKANGQKVKALKKALVDLGLYLNDLDWTEIRSYSFPGRIVENNSNPLRLHEEIKRI